MTETEKDTSKRGRFEARMRNLYPDREFADDEELFGQIYDDYDEYESKISENAKRERAFSDMFTSNPKSARLMMEWKDGKDPVASLIRIYGKDTILEAIEDPARLDEIEEANIEFAKRVAENDEYEAQYERNFPESIRNIESWMQETGHSEEDVDKALETLTKICGDFILGKFTPETVEMILKALNHDSDVAAAAEEGEIAGRNARIEEKLRKGREGDGTRPLGGRNETPSQPKGAQNMFDWAAMA